MQRAQRVPPPPTPLSWRAQAEERRGHAVRVVCPNALSVNLHIRKPLCRQRRVVPHVPGQALVGHGARKVEQRAVPLRKLRVEVQRRRPGRAREVAAVVRQQLAQVLSGRDDDVLARDVPTLRVPL